MIHMQQVRIKYKIKFAKLIKISIVIVQNKRNSKVLMLEPIAKHHAHLEPISDLAFLRDCVVTSCWGGNAYKRK
jgi:hypothetical protein